MKEFGRGLAHGGVQGTSSVITGGKFGYGFASGAISSWTGSTIRRTSFGRTAGGMLGLSALSGGLVSHLSGGDFLKGLGSGFMTGFLNHMNADPNYWKEIHNQEKEIQKILSAMHEGGDYVDLMQVSPGIEKCGQLQIWELLKKYRFQQFPNFVYLWTRVF